MGLSSSKDRSLSPCHKAALAAYSEDDKQRMHAQFCACCGKGGEHIHQDALMVRRLIAFDQSFRTDVVAIAQKLHADSLPHASASAMLHDTQSTRSRSTNW